ncbi:unnamed protein product [Rangifer tarandus platyrhynchus]|uniref:Uncharacterized protein n=1 Tax=Rangifer tarandus platyrhynchus TaxID=3082113 RepID=A0ACB1KHH7_RANTA
MKVTDPEHRRSFPDQEPLNTTLCSSSQRCALSWGPRSSEYRCSSLNIYGAIPHRTTWVWAGEAWVLCMNGTPEVYPVTAGEVLAPITRSVLCRYEFRAQWQC